MHIAGSIEIFMKEKLTELFSKYTYFYIAGAQSRAKTLTGQLRFLYPEAAIEAYLVDDPAENDTQIGQAPVLAMAKGAQLHTEYPVFIATKGIYHEKIAQELKAKGFQRIIPLTVEADNYFRNAYVKKVFAQQGRSFYKLDIPNKAHGSYEADKSSKTKMTSVSENGKMTGLSEAAWEQEKRLPSACIYMARSIYDKPLDTAYACPPYEKPIQAGAALTGQRLEADILTDAVGDNISHKNRQYCELTVLYWVWKHAQEEILGLSHYRRHFILPSDWLARMRDEQIDVILPVPTYVQPSIAENYKERHDAADWEYMIHYLQEHDRQGWQLGKAVFAGTLYTPCNMFIMRREILNELCGWMFPILNAVTAQGGIKEDTYLNRYAGFLSERLMTLFFEKNRDRYRIAYADKNFLK